MDIKDRINLIMERENVKSGAFAESLGMVQSTLSHILTGRNKPSLEVVMKVHKRYSYVNLEWLLYGTGEMMNDKSKTTSSPFSSEQREFSPSLFDETPLFTDKSPNDSEYRLEIGLPHTEKASKETVVQEVKYIERPHRKITEIRIFFDDNTYETFKGEK